MKLHTTGITDVGRRRTRNEDAFLINDELGLYVVADGMGGHAGGRVASTLAVSILEEEVIAWLGRPVAGDDPVEHHRQGLSEAVAHAGQRVFQISVERPEWKGMGTTIVAVMMVGSNAFIAHVGDSRAYLIRDGRIEQITDDHSLVAESVRSGAITEEQAKHHRMRNVITRALGFQEEVEVDVQVRGLARGDQLLLCTDGLSGKLEPHDIRRVLQERGVFDAPRQLVLDACERGGEDNITVVCVGVERTT